MLFSGLRLGEALGLTWDDMDFAGGFIRVRRQLDRDRKRAPLKTVRARRDVVLMPELAFLLRKHRQDSPSNADTDFVFAVGDGKGYDHRAASRGVERALERAGLADEGITPHSFRHTFASILIVGLGCDVLTVSRQLGHARPSITTDVYGHLFEEARVADELRAKLGGHYGHLLGADDVNALSTRARLRPVAGEAGTA
jgi:integrase